MTTVGDGQAMHGEYGAGYSKVFSGLAVRTTGGSLHWLYSDCLSQLIPLNQSAGNAGLLNRLKSSPVKRRTIEQAIVNLLWQ